MLKFDIDPDYPLLGLENCRQGVEMLIGLISGKSDMEFMDGAAVAGLVAQLQAISGGISDVHEIVHAQLCERTDKEPRLTTGKRSVA
ncbi:hypothetical protein CSR02_00015 [Acetobacter pomorum]|uniref:Uncharacterized protein n=1 Tax=Acetobacter pomorum TaxID=65959 RepID=A0A2G4RIL3_9PROT|nr:hypothetical protein [Acetobacter pomorum]PHY95565.1 hypothetical protein CSR02_00015 [Acetobacter pomorum]GBR50043.1 hypothetical protein AA11825_1551 [Acetobacter pomorum DSM 11825]